MAVFWRRVLVDTGLKTRIDSSNAARSGTSLQDKNELLSSPDKATIAQSETTMMPEDKLLLTALFRSTGVRRARRRADETPSTGVIQG
jgi:hypothetical protein